MDGVPAELLCADQHDPRAAGCFSLTTCFGQQRLDSDQLADGDAGEKVIEGQHCVGLAPAEVGLQLNNGIPALGLADAQAPIEQALEAYSQ